MDTKTNETDKDMTDSTKEVSESNKESEVAAAKAATKSETKPKSSGKTSDKALEESADPKKKPTRVKDGEKAKSSESTKVEETDKANFRLHTIKTPVPAYLGRHLNSLCLGTVQGDVYLDSTTVNGFITCIFGGYERGSVTGYIPKEYIGSI